MLTPMSASGGKFGDSNASNAEASVLVVRQPRSSLLLKYSATSGML